MSVTTLLSPTNARLATMTLRRVMLDAQHPSEHLPIRDELCIYPLIGSVRVHVDMMDYGVIGGRVDVRTADVQAVRVGIQNYEVAFTLEGYTADILVASVKTDSRVAPFIHHRGQCHIHPVGTGTHRREVRELPVPPGYTLHMGETLNDAGAWSSWPDHSTWQERDQYAHHQECFYVITPGYGLMYLDGLYVDGTPATGPQLVTNDQAFVTPLGSHPIVASPDAWLYYCWVYQSFLQKTYNRWSHEGIKTYVK